MIPQIKTENELRKLAGIPIKEAEGGSLDNILAKHRESFESVMRGDSFLYDHDEFYDELYEYFVTGDGRGQMPYGTMKARDGDPDEWIMGYLEAEYGNDFATDEGDGEPMDGDFDSAMASAGLGTDEDYGYYGEGKSHSCATHVEHKEFGKGKCIPTQHSLIETDNGEYKVTHYDVKFGSGIKKTVPVKELKIIKESHHKHKKAKVVEGPTGPTRMEIQNYFSKQEGLTRAKITATEKAFHIKDLKIDSNGQVASYKLIENKEPKTFREHLEAVQEGNLRSDINKLSNQQQGQIDLKKNVQAHDEMTTKLGVDPLKSTQALMYAKKQGIEPSAMVKQTPQYKMRSRGYKSDYSSIPPSSPQGNFAPDSQQGNLARVRAKARRDA